MSDTCVMEKQTGLPSERPIDLNWLPLIVLGVILSIGAFFRTYALGDECFDCDELYAVRIQGLSLTHLGMVVGRDGLETNHPPLMTLPFLVWNSIFGTSEASVRALPVLLGILTLFVIYRLGALLHSPLAGCYAALLTALNPLHIDYSREARQYAMLVLLIGVAHLLFVRLLQQTRRVALVGYYICVSLALFTHYFAIPALAAHGVILIVLFLRGNSDCRRTSLSILLPYLLAIIPFSAWLPMLRHQASQPWSHLANADTGTLLSCLMDVTGLGAAGSIVWCILGTIIFGGLAVLAFVRDWDRPLLIADGVYDVPSPSPRLGTALAICGIGCVLAVFLAFPNLIAPLVVSALHSYGYTDESVRRQLGVLKRTLELFPLTLSLLGLLICFWPAIVARLLPIPSMGIPRSRPLAVAMFTSLLVLVPLGMVGLIGLLGIPFVTPRNLLILVPPINLLLGFGLAACSTSRLGRVVIVLSLLVMLGSYSHYDALVRPFGRSGKALGMTTFRWRDLTESLRPLGTDIPILTVHSPTSDPALYYLSEWQITRVRDAHEFLAGASPAHFRFLGLKKVWASQQFMTRLDEMPVTSSTLLETDEFVVLDIKSRPSRSTP